MIKSWAGGRVLIGLVVALCLLFVFVQPVFAGLKVTGAVIEATVVPGSKTTYRVNVADTQDTPMDVIVELKGYGEAQTGIGILDPAQDNSPYSARQFLTVSPDSLHLEPGQSQDITVTANVPAGVGDGGRYAIVYIHTVPPQGSVSANIAAVAVRVLLAMGGSHLIKSGEISQIQLTQADPGQPLKITAALRNTGNYHYKISATGQVKNSKGKVVATSLPEQGVLPLLPSYSSQISLSFDSKSLTQGSFRAEIEVKADDGTIAAQVTYPFTLGEPWPLPPKEGSNWALIGGTTIGGVFILALALLLALYRRKQGVGVAKNN